MSFPLKTCLKPVLLPGNDPGEGLEPGEGGGGVVEAGLVALHRLPEGVRKLHGEQVCVKTEQVDGE